METVETHIQVRLHPTKEQEVVLKRSCELYLKCLNEASKYYFEHDCNLTENQLKKSIGKSLRDEFGLSPLVASAIKEVLLYYKEEEMVKLFKQERLHLHISKRKRRTKTAKGFIVVKETYCV